MSMTRMALPEERRPQLKRLIERRVLLRAMECHDPLSAVIAQSASAGASSRAVHFDVLWASGFSRATSMALPDAELFLHERRMDVLSDIAAVTTRPILADGDTGGDALAFVQLCRRLEQIGVSGVVIEDKRGSKRTSLSEQVNHELEDASVFVEKLEYARAKLSSADFLIFARTEALIAGAGIERALERVRTYLRSGADGIVIHSKDRSGREIVEFLAGYRALQAALGIEKPLICIPTAYNHMTAAELHARGAQIVIYGNHMIRAAFRGMQLAARSVLEHDRSLEADALCAPLPEIFDSIGVDA